ncbi:outer membrane protein OmpU [Paracoccus solventivorans]|uniref:Outer membrane protein OmpU n=1 Tax=Paracoccus solventivorans TaxID=53463 RepID=A0A1M7GK41_9RHOB|nr:porin [Paracoccus solventivorans]SHM16505.1 outer membrane protein OmpU [Paracoccus solventivorans]
MQKALLATTALVLSAGVAAADVTISGYGRTGIIYYENDSDLRETQVSSRIRMNLDATTESDAGVEFGARLRLQHDQNGSRQSVYDFDDEEYRHDGRDEIRTQAGKVWISAQGLTVEIGNVDTAFDSAGLLYATDLGSYDRSGAFAPSVDLSAMAGGFFTYTDSYVSQNRVGVAANYSFGDLTVRASYVDPDQSDMDTDVVSDIIGNDEKELGISADYKWDDRLELSGAYTNNAGGWDGVDLFFVGARYAVLENARIGLNYVNADDFNVGGVADNAFGQTVALYGDYTLADGLTNIEAYVANNDGDWATKETDNAFGIGVNYDLGGARLGASIHRDYRELVSADMGVRFNF